MRNVVVGALVLIASFWTIASLSPLTESSYAQHMGQLRGEQENGLNAFTWTGVIDGDPTNPLTLTYNQGFVGANVKVPDGEYSIQYELGRHVLKKFTVNE